MAINTLPFLNQMNKGVAKANTNNAMPQLDNNGDPITPEKIEQYRRYKLGQIVSGGNSFTESITFDLSSVSVDKNSKSVSVNIGLVANSFNTHLKNGKTGDALYKAVAKDIAASTGITHMSQYNGSKINEEYLSKLQDFETTDFETLETVIANQVYAQKNEIAKYAKENTLYDLGENPAKSLEEELVYKIVSGTANNDYYGQKIVSLPVAQGNNQNNDERLRIYSTDNGKIVFTKHKENLDRLDKGLSSPIFYYAEFDGKTVGEPQILQSDYLSQNTTIDEKGSVLITGNEELTNGRYKNKTQSLDESSSFLSENGTNLKFDDNKKQQAFTNAYETKGRKTEDRINNYNGSVSNEYQITNVDKTSLNNSLNANVNIKSESVPVPSKSTAKFLSEYYKENGKEFNGKAVVMSPMGEKAPFSSNQIEVNNGVVQSEKSGSTIKEYDDVNSFQNGRNNNNRIASTSAERSLVAHEQGENTSNLGTEYYQEGDPTYYQDARVYTVDVNNPAGGYERVLRREERDYLIRQLSSGESLQTNDDGVLLELLKQNPNAVSNLGLNNSLLDPNGTLKTAFKAAFNSGFSSKEGINISDLTANNINNIKDNEEVTPLNLTIFDENGDILLTIPESEVLSIIDKLEDNNLSFKDKKGNDQRLSLNTLMEDDIVSNEIITSKKSGEFSGPKIAKQKLYDELSGADNNNSRKIEYAKAVGQYNVNNNKINLQPIKYSSEVKLPDPPKEPVLVDKNRAKALLDEAISKNETYRKDLSLATNPKIVSNQGIQPFTPPMPEAPKKKLRSTLPDLKPPKETPTTTLTATPTTTTATSQPTVNKAPSQTIGGDGLLRNAKKDILFDINRFNYYRYGQDKNGDWYAIADNISLENAIKEGEAIGFNNKEDVETFINEYKKTYAGEYEKGNRYKRLSNDGVNPKVEFSAERIEKNTTNTTQAAPANTTNPKPLPAVGNKTTPAATATAQTTSTATAPAAQPVATPSNTSTTKPQVGLPPVTSTNPTTSTQPVTTSPATSNMPVTSTQPGVTPPKETVNPVQTNTTNPTAQPQVGLPAVNNTAPAQPETVAPQQNATQNPELNKAPKATSKIHEYIDFSIPFNLDADISSQSPEQDFTLIEDNGNWYVVPNREGFEQNAVDPKNAIKNGQAIKVNNENDGKAFIQELGNLLEEGNSYLSIDNNGDDLTFTAQNNALKYKENSVSHIFTKDSGLISKIAVQEDDMEYYSYHLNGNLEYEIISKDDETISFTSYYKDGNLKGISKNGIETSYEYDKDGNLSKEIVKPNSKQDKETNELIVGNQTYNENEIPTITTEYDADGNITSKYTGDEYKPENALPLTETDPNVSPFDENGVIKTDIVGEPGVQNVEVETPQAAAPQNNNAQTNNVSEPTPQVGLPQVTTEPAQQPVNPPVTNPANTAIETPTTTVSNTTNATPNVQPQVGLPQPTGTVNTPPAINQPANAPQQNTAQQNIPRDILAAGKLDISSDIDFDVPFYFKMNNELSIGEGKDGNWYVYSQIDVDGELKFDIEKSIAKGEAIKVKSESSAKNVLNGIYSLANSETENLRFSNINRNQKIYIGSKEGSNSKEVIINNDGTKLIEINGNGYQRFYEFDENNNIETASLYNEDNYNEETGLYEVNGTSYKSPPYIEIDYNEDGTIASQKMSYNDVETDISSANINTGTNPFDETGQVKQEILNGNNTPSPEVNQPVAPQVETNTQPTTPAAGLPPLPTPLETKNTTLNQSSPQNALDYITSPESIASLSPDIQANVPPIETSTVQYNPKYTGPLLRPKDRFDQTFTSNDFQNPFASVSVNDPRSIGTDESGNPILPPQIAGFKKPYIPPLSESGQRILPPHLANLRRPTVPPQELGLRMENVTPAMPILPGGNVVSVARRTMMPGGDIANPLNSTSEKTIDQTKIATTNQTENNSSINQSETSFGLGGQVYDLASAINIMRAGSNYIQPPPPRVQMERMDPARVRVDRAPFEQASQQMTAQGNDMINTIQDNTGSASSILAAGAQVGTNMANAQNQINAQYSQVAQNVMAQNAQMQQQANQFNAQMGSQENQVNAQLQMQASQMKQQAIDQNINAALAAQAQKQSYLMQSDYVNRQTEIQRRAAQYQLDMERYARAVQDPTIQGKLQAKNNEVNSSFQPLYGPGSAKYNAAKTQFESELETADPVTYSQYLPNYNAMIEAAAGDETKIEEINKQARQAIVNQRLITDYINPTLTTYKQSMGYDEEAYKKELGLVMPEPMDFSDLEIKFN